MTCINLFRTATVRSTPVMHDSVAWGKINLDENTSTLVFAALLIVFKVPGALGGTEKVAHKLQSSVHEAFTHIEHALVKA